MSDLNWEEIRTAYEVAKHGTVSGAAAELGVHHATVIRHIDALEHRLGVRLFRRHARGYSATEEGRELFRVASVTDEQISLLEGRLRGQAGKMTGELVVSVVPGPVVLVAHVVAKFQLQYPEVTVRVLMDEAIVKLEYGAAHVALRGGAPPQEPDNIARKLARYEMGLYAAPSYVERFGVPASIAQFGAHRFVGHDRENQGAMFNRWMRRVVPIDRILTRSNDFGVLEAAVIRGAGIGFVGEINRLEHPELVEIMAPLEEWAIDFWVVTHVDMHHTTKVQAFLQILKEVTTTWQHL
ncbi:MAG: LysR family transcriptional regulator [Paracoccaceae bacterium]